HDAGLRRMEPDRMAPVVSRVAERQPRPGDAAVVRLVQPAELPPCGDLVEADACDQQVLRIERIARDAADPARHAGLLRRRMQLPGDAAVDRAIEAEAAVLAG